MDQVRRTIVVGAPIAARKSYAFCRAQRHMLINIVVISLVALCWQLSCFLRTNKVEPAYALLEKGLNPCCAFPCRHGGVCVPLPNNFECDCLRTGYYGKTCQMPNFYRWFEGIFCPSREFVIEFNGKYPLIWKILRLLPNVRHLIAKFTFLAHSTVIPLPPAYSILHDYSTLEAFYNQSAYKRHLPPIPRNCPTEMGIHGPKKLPDVSEVYDRLFKRKKFIPCPKGTNIFFVAWNLFAHQHLYKTDYYSGVDYTLGKPRIPEDRTNLYGTLGQKHNPLRSHQNGKLSMKTIGGEDYPDIEPYNEYLLHSLGLADRGPDGKPCKALSSISAPLFVITTLWAREHNRVCDMLKADHYDWDDDKLYETSRLVVTGLLTQLTFRNLIHHMNQNRWRLKYRPEMTHFTTIQHYNVYLQELIHVFEWHSQLPEVMKIEGQRYNFKDDKINKSTIFHHGFNNFLASMFTTIAGKVTALNNSPMLENVRKSLIKESRIHRLQSFNNYRQSLLFKPYSRFEDFNKNPEIVNALKELYGHVDAVELYAGLFADKDCTAITPKSMLLIYNTWYTKWIASSPLHSFTWWKPITFGGQKFYDIVCLTTLKEFICRNVRGSCTKMQISFSVSDDVKEAISKRKCI